MLTFLPAAELAGQRASKEPASTSATRYVVTFDSRTFDLDPMRRAIRNHDEERAAALADDFLAKARDDRAEFVDELDELGGRVVRHFWLIDAAEIEIPAGSRSAVEAMPGVERVYENAVRRPGAFGSRSRPGTATRPIRTVTNASNHNADAAHALGVRGAGAVIAVLDSAFDSDVGGAGRPHQTFYPNGNLNLNGGGIGNSRLLANIQVGLQPPDRADNHGTRVAAVAAGGRWNTPAGDDGQAPEAGIVGYSISDLPDGTTVLATVVAAWQQATLDTTRFGTKVANISYFGADDPLLPDQQAMDAAVSLADLFIAAMAGNEPTRTRLYHSAPNVLTVGSVTNDTRVLSFFSPRTPPPAPVSSVYPHVVANGEGLTVPDIDNDSLDTSANGTSYSAPNTAGAAALFRSIAPNASSDETRAAILASTENVRAQNPAGPEFTGHGYVRTDRLVGLARGEGRFETGSVSTVARSWSTSVPITAGQRYAIATSWSQHVIGDTSWADLSLFVRVNGRGVASSTEARGTNERVEFLATSSGVATIEVFAEAFENSTVHQDFGIAIYHPGGGASIEPYATGCGRPVDDPSTRAFEPNRLGQRFGSSSSTALFRSPQSRTQSIIDVGFPGVYNIQAILLRFDDVLAVGSQQRWVELEIDIGTRATLGNTFSTNFAANRPANTVTAVRRRRIPLPASTSPAMTPSQFDLIIPLDLSVDRGGGSPQHRRIMIEVRTYRNSTGGPLSYPLDAATASGVATLHANSPTATTGTLTTGAVPVFGFGLEAGTTLPFLNAVGRPGIGSSYTLVATDLPSNTPAGLNLGLSRTTLAGQRLPLDLAPFGARGCFLHTSIEASASLTTDRFGRITLPISIPNQPALIGGELFHQAIAADPLANVLGIATTNGIAVRIGR